MPMPPSVALPTLSRIDFFTAEPDELVRLIGNAVATDSTVIAPSDAHLALAAWNDLSVDVPNGGFTQFFYNHRGDGGLAALCELLESLDLGKAASMLETATATYRKYRDRFDTTNPWEGLFGSIPEFDALDRKFARIGPGKVALALSNWARLHLDDLVVGDDGQPIDQKFTGTVETYFPGGAVAQSLCVKKGKADGPWREFFDDETVRQVRFYKSGKASGDYWPNGELKRKQSKRGTDKVLDWYYPSGRLEKRLVLDKNDQQVEPARLYYEDGQLAEEMTLLGGTFDERYGPWLKFFPDGSPRLQGEASHYGTPRVIVHNAWDDEHRQVVKDGTGLFDDDGRRIDASYALFFESLWRTVSELKHGVPNGLSRMYKNGLLWSVTPHVDGIPQGESVHYYDNGRVRSRHVFEKGREISHRDFPKFDNPEPVVRLVLEANEQLYKGWRHMPVDDYPAALNLVQIQDSLNIPQFLREIQVRNQNGTIRSEY